MRWHFYSQSTNRADEARSSLVYSLQTPVLWQQLGWDLDSENLDRNLLGCYTVFGCWRLEGIYCLHRRREAAGFFETSEISQRLHGITARKITVWTIFNSILSCCSFTVKRALRQVHSLFQSELIAEYYLSNKPEYSGILECVRCVIGVNTCNSRCFERWWCPHLQGLFRRLHQRHTVTPQKQQHCDSSKSGLISIN